MILQAAEQQFFERSFDGVGVAAIGAQAGITPSAIYRHFEGKGEILAVLFDHAIDALMQLTSDTVSDPEEELRYLIAGHAEFAVSHPRLAAIWSREQHALVEPYRRRVRRRQKQYIDRWVDALAACYPGRTKPDILAVMRALHSIMTSDETRPAPVQRSSHLKDLLIAIATNAVRALENPATTRALPQAN